MASTTAGKVTSARERAPPYITVDTSVAGPLARRGAPSRAPTDPARPPTPPLRSPARAQQASHGQTNTQSGTGARSQIQSKSRGGGKSGKQLPLIMPESLQRMSTRSPTQSVGTPTSVASAFTPTGATRHYDPTPPAMPGSTPTPPSRPRKSALRKKSLSRLSGILRQTRSSGNLQSGSGSLSTWGFRQSSGQSSGGGVSSEDYAKVGHNNPLTRPIKMPEGPSRATLLRQKSLERFHSLLKTRPPVPPPPVPSVRNREPQPMPKSILINRRTSKDQKAGQLQQAPASSQNQSQTRHGGDGEGQGQQNTSQSTPKSASTNGGPSMQKEGVRYQTRPGRAEPQEQPQSRKSAAVSVLDISPEKNIPPPPSIEVVDDIATAFSKATNKRLPPVPQRTPSPKQVEAKNVQEKDHTTPRADAQKAKAIPSSLKPGPAPPPAPNHPPAYSKPKQPSLHPQESLSHISGSKAKENAEVMQRLEEERRAIRLQSRENFNSQVWGPALNSDLAEAMRLANERSGTTEASVDVDPDEEKKRYTLPPIHPLFIQKKMPSEEAETKRSGTRESETDWAHGVRLAMAKLENRIQTEANKDPKAFMRARRESAQLRAWVASQKRASEARLSALASGRARPQSPFEQEFVAQLLKESDEKGVKVKHSETPMAEADRMWRGYGSGLTGTTASGTFGTGTFNHYTPFSLTPLAEMDNESGSGSPVQHLALNREPTQQQKQQQPSRTQDQSAPILTQTQAASGSSRMSTFEEKKAARRAGLRDYKSFSSFSTSDMSVAPGALCCNLDLGRFWKPDKVKKQ